MQCKICGNLDNNIEHFAKEMLYGFPEIFNYFECSNCNCVQIFEVPENLENYYTSDYHCHTLRATKNPIKKYLITLRNKYAVFGSNFIGQILYYNYPQEALFSLRTIKLNKNWNILDVGCGNGILIHYLYKLGFHKVVGIDPFIYPKEEIKSGFVILKKVLSEVKGKWDLIMFHHSLEHIPDQQITLNNIARLLADNGICIIRMPVVDSFTWKNYGTNWIGFDAPRHLFIHSIKSISLLAERAGLEMNKIIYDSSEMQFWASEQFLQNIYFYSPNSYFTNRKKSIFSRKRIRHFKVQAKKLNEAGRGDQAIFILKKIKVNNK